MKEYHEKKSMKIAINALALSSQKTGGGVYMVNLIENLAQIDSINHYYIFINPQNLGQFTKLPQNFTFLSSGFLGKYRPTRIIYE